ncbi:Acyltransferase 3 [Candidatus Paraburkholderia kirkii]|nr:Acyltransferase 3 [Candidatus Paraburkholderia kirkii]
MEFRKDINGLRAVAVTAVVLFHYGVAQTGGGFVGVDVFFMISGFLLTSIAHQRLKERRFSAAAFLLNRMRCIFPALVVLALACVVWGGFRYLPPDTCASCATPPPPCYSARTTRSSATRAATSPPTHIAISCCIRGRSPCAVESQFYLGFALLCRFF